MIIEQCSEELKKSNLDAKLVVKKWEDDYKKNHGTRPSKEALHQAPSMIKDAYKTYWRTSKQLSLLRKENTSADSTSNKDGINHDLTELSGHKSGDSNKVRDIKTKMKVNSGLNLGEKEIVIEDVPKVDLKGVWGNHLNKSSEKIENVQLGSSLYSKMAEKLKNHAIVKIRTSLKRLPSKSVSDDIDQINNTLQSSVLSNSQSDNNYLALNEEQNVNSTNTNQFPRENLQTEPSERIPSHPMNCVITKSIKKMNFHSVSHVAYAKSHSKIQKPHHWNEGWVRRCSGIYDIDDHKIDRMVSENYEKTNFVSNNVENSYLNDSGGITNLVTDIESLQQTDKIDHNFNQENFLKRKNTENEDICLQSNSSKKMKLCDSQDHSGNKSLGDSWPSESIQMDQDIPANSLNEPETQKDSRIKSKRIRKPHKEKPEAKTSLKRQFKIKVVPKKSLQKLNEQAPEKNLGEMEEVKKMENFEYDELTDMQKNAPQKTFQRRYLSKEERFEQKVLSGKANDNFVKINLKKKIFVRGKKKMTTEKYKRQEWKKREIVKNADAGNERAIKKFTCFRCGEFGHWANKCLGNIGDKLLPVAEYDENESTFLTVEEAANLARGIQGPSESTVIKVYANEQEEPKISSDDDIFSDWDDDFVDAIDSEKVVSKSSKEDVNELPSSIPPLCRSDTLSDKFSTAKEVEKTLKLFGYDGFRRGQERAIMRILSGKSTLVVQSTGSGKSLCYQLPAYLYAQNFKSITLCISPLVSLMEDQVSGLPSFLNAVCLHTQQSSKNREKALDALRSGKVHILLISPEAIVSSRGSGVLGTLLKELPSIAFACLDEAHCLSEWSHNFRPSYLQICQILKERFHVNTFLGLTATARNETIASIAKHLEIHDLEQGVICGTCIPENLKLSVSRDSQREKALIQLLTGSRFEGCKSIIIYCTRRDECERIATFIRTQMTVASRIDVKNNVKKRRGMSLDAEAYHAGLSSYRRQQVQKNFMNGTLRIVVATVAFGMGIDKADVEGIIHFNMPRNLESYAQEIGRAGRNGNAAHCHLFLDNVEGQDIQELKRHIFANSVDRFTVRKLLNKILVLKSCSKIGQLIDDSKQVEVEDGIESASQRAGTSLTNSHSISLRNYFFCPGHEMALTIDKLIEELDLPEENIQTLICYLESQPNCKLKLSHRVYASCKVSCYGGPKQLCAVSRKCPPLAVAVALQRKKGKNFDSLNSIDFPVVEIAAQMGWESKIVKQELKKLEWNTSGGNFRPSGVKVELYDLAFHLTCRCDLSEEEQDQVLKNIYERTCTQERNQLKQLKYTYEVLSQSSCTSAHLCCDTIDEDKNLSLKEKISHYFTGDGCASVCLEEPLYIRPEVEQRIRSDIRSLLSIHSDHSWTGRAVARILHGISSPNYPAKVWGKARRFWRLHLSTDFNLLLTIATKEILKNR